MPMLSGLARPSVAAARTGASRSGCVWVGGMSSLSRCITIRLNSDGPRHRSPQRYRLLVPYCHGPFLATAQLSRFVTTRVSATQRHARSPRCPMNASCKPSSGTILCLSTFAIWRTGGRFSPCRELIDFQGRPLLLRTELYSCRVAVGRALSGPARLWYPPGANAIWSRVRLGMWSGSSFNVRLPPNHRLPQQRGIETPGFNQHYLDRWL